MTKTMTTSVFPARDGYAKRSYEVTTTNGSEKVSITLRPLDAYSGLGASMTPSMAHRLALDLKQRAESLSPALRREKVIGRVYWDPDHVSPWVTFDNISAFRQWTRDIRKIRPGLRTEMAYLHGTSGPEWLLSCAAEQEDE